MARGPDSAPTSWLPPAPVVLGCLLGCLLPVIAYAEAMAALFSFGICRRRWAALLIAVPSAVWLCVAWRGASWDQEPRWARVSTTALILAAQLVLAAAVSAVIGRVIARRRAEPRRCGGPVN